ncbi:hypothetical protein FACS189491_09150 [Spirochaetia bacterium]|nr:hypothetical protein FACS189491_09150 [Spirochaetia bacterium]
MPVFLLGLCVMFLSCASREAASQEVTAPVIEVSQAELDAFNLTRYTDKEYIPLENLVTPAGLPFDPRELRGKYVFLNFWTTWCPYCAQEKPSIQQLYQESDTFTVLTVSLGEKAGTVQEYMETNGYSFPVLVNASNSLREAWAPRIPATYILDTDGSIIARINGNKDWTSGQAVQILEFVVQGLQGR